MPDISSEAVVQSYMPIIIEPARALMHAGMYDELETLVVLASHADLMGICFPQPRYIAGMIGRRVERVVECLNALIELNYVRAWQHVDEEIRRSQYRYQLSPSVLFIRTELQSEAWVKFFNRDKHYVILVVINDHDPESSTNVRSNRNSQLPKPVPNQRQQPADSSEVSGAKAVHNSDLETLPGENFGEQNRIVYPASCRQANNGNRPNSVATSSAATPHTPPTPSLPPTQGDADALAYALKAAAPDLTLKLCAEMVTQHGFPAASHALALMNEELERREITNRAGWLRHMVAEVSSRQRQQPPVEKYHSGKYADYVEK